MEINWRRKQANQSSQIGRQIQTLIKMDNEEEEDDDEDKRRKSKH